MSMPRTNTAVDGILNRWDSVVNGISNRSVLARGAVGAVLTMVLGVGVTFACHACLARILGLNVFGQYVYVLAWAVTLAIVGRLGLDIATIRFMGAYYGRQEWPLVRGFRRRSLQLTLLASLAVAGLVSCGVMLFRDLVGEQTMWLLLWGACLLPVIAVQDVVSAHFRSLKRVVLAKLPRSIINPVLVAVVITVFALSTGDTPTAAGVLAVAVFGQAIVLVVLWRLLVHCTPQEARTAPPEYRTSLWIKSSLPLVFVSGVHVISFRIDVLMLGALRGPQDAGIYTAAVLIAGLTAIALVGVNSIAGPLISEMYAQNRKEELQAIVSLAAKGIALLTVPLCLLLIFTGRLLLDVFGTGFSAGYAALIILTLGQFANGMAGSVGYLMIMSGNQNQAARILGIGAGLNVVLNLFLIQWLGMVGAAVSTAVTTVFWNAAMLVFVRNRLGINPTILPHKP